MEPTRCKAHRLKMDDVDRSVDDPALAAMLSAGWTVICPIAMEERGELMVTLILAPPSNRVIFRRLGLIATVLTVGVIAALIFSSGAL